MNTIICPNCKKEVEISKALTIQIQEEILSKEHEKHEKELELARKTAVDESAKMLTEQFALQIKLAKDDSEAKDRRIQKLIEDITKLSENLRESKKERDEAKIEMQKQLAVEEDKIRTQAQEEAEEAQHLKILEKDKQLQDALKVNEELNRKLLQGSQQTQGEAFELEFEHKLKTQYPNDKITSVAKGVRGGDIIQEVWDRNGNFTGKILWELKNTKTWSEGWIDKLRGDQRLIKAEEAVLISETMPSNMKVAGFRSNIWITERLFVFPLADTLRAKLIQLYYVRNSVQSKDEKMEILYGYLSGTEFKHRVEAIIEAFTNMQAEIEKEKRYFSNKWARDEKNIRQVIDNTYGMHGDLKGIIGNSIPQIKGLELLEASNDN